MTTEPNFVIVGGGLAGAIAAQTLREEGFDGRITLLGEEPNRPYERPPCPRTISRVTLTVTASSSTRRLGTPSAVELCLGVSLTSLNPALRTATTATGTRLRYDKLLLATGSTPRRLGVPGADLDGVYYLRSVEDSERIKIEFAQAKRVVIIGAGWIGLETAAAARNAGLDVTLLERGQLPLLHVLGPRLHPSLPTCIVTTVWTCVAKLRWPH